MQFISPEHRQEEIPCRFVQLRADGANIDSLCRSSTPWETEETVRDWLLFHIRELERTSATTSKR